jgi:hypothetical protein
MAKRLGRCAVLFGLFRLGCAGTLSAAERAACLECEAAGEGYCIAEGVCALPDEDGELRVCDSPHDHIASDAEEAEWWCRKYGDSLLHWNCSAQYSYDPDTEGVDQCGRGADAEQDCDRRVLHGGRRPNGPGGGRGGGDGDGCGNGGARAHADDDSDSESSHTTVLLVMAIVVTMILAVLCLVFCFGAGKCRRRPVDTRRRAPDGVVVMVAPVAAVEMSNTVAGNYPTAIVTASPSPPLAKADVETL